MNVENKKAWAAPKLQKLAAKLAEGGPGGAGDAAGKS